MSDLGTLGGVNSYGYAVNSSDQVVGKSQTSNGSEYHAFLYSNGQMVDLNTLIASDPNSVGVTLTSAVGINDEGWIVANGTATSGCFIPRVGEPACTFVLVPTGE
jgi:probable HAF family extracellular repeat protein